LSMEVVQSYRHAENISGVKKGAKKEMTPRLAMIADKG